MEKAINRNKLHSGKNNDPQDRNRALGGNILPPDGRQLGEQG